MTGDDGRRNPGAKQPRAAKTAEAGKQSALAGTAAGTIAGRISGAALSCTAAAESCQRLERPARLLPPRHGSIHLPRFGSNSPRLMASIRARVAGSGATPSSSRNRSVSSSAWLNAAPRPLYRATSFSARALPVLARQAQARSTARPPQARPRRRRAHQHSGRESRTQPPPPRQDYAPRAHARSRSLRCRERGLAKTDRAKVLPPSTMRPHPRILRARRTRAHPPKAKRCPD